MRKILTVVLVLITAGLFSADWYGTREKIGSVRPETAQKDTMWYGYYPGYAYVWSIPDERAVKVNADDFGLEYPVKLHAIDSYLYEPGYNYQYRVYDTDGITLLWESPVDAAADDYYNIQSMDPALVIKNDFWISVVPLDGSHPTLVSSDVVDETHSYYKSEGNWVPFNVSGDNYEWAIDFGLSPYTSDDGEDIFPPLLRAITGLENFENADANLAISVQDNMSAVVSPMPAQYSLDGGTSWTDFFMTLASKGTYTFTGTVPGQADGTEALVKFNMSDELGNSVWSDEYTVTWSRDLPLLSEGFEGDFPPAGWNNAPAPTGSGFAKAITSDGAEVFNGKAVMVHWDTAVDNDDWIWTPVISLPSTNSCTFSFWQQGVWQSYYFLHEVAISTDGGATNTVLYSGAPTTSEPDYGPWENLVFVLTAYAGQDVTLGFHYAGNYNDQWFIDDVKVIYDYQYPSITDIAANEALLPDVGAYLDNDMEISLTLEDQSGTAFVTGHYSFDGGTTYTDVVFSAAKGTEIWTGSVPAMSSVADGLIYFDLGDLGGVSGTTGTYPIKFVADTGDAEIVSFSYGAPVFINNDMTLNLVFTDESAITSISGYYSKDNWVTSTPVEMTPSKAHLYTYTGVIPAETAETFAQVIFEIGDAPGNFMQSQPYDVEWLDGAIIFFDDFDANYDPANWIFPTGTTWGRTETSSYSPTHSMTDSPSGNYGDNLATAIYTKFMDFSTFKGATMYFWAKIDLETGWDYTYLQGSDDNGMTWKTLAEFNGEDIDWQEYQVSLGAFAESASVYFRWILYSDSNTNADGMCMDDVKIAGYNQDYSWPLPFYEGPPAIVGTEDYVFTADFDDYTGVSETKVVYSVDGGAEQENLASPSSGPAGMNTYTYTIPAQAAGSTVTYKLVATDATVYQNTVETETYTIMFGYHLNYTNGEEFIDYLDIIGTDSQASAFAVAKRLTMGPMDPAKIHYAADLVGFTIANYVSASYPSDPLYAHVWANENGKPGADLIAPIWMEQGSTLEDPYALTMVDLRPYAATLSGLEGDVFVGFTTAGTKTNVLYEVAANHTGSPGYVKFDRSWLGQKSGDDIVWSLDAADVYHITGITGSWTEIDGPLPPMGLAYTTSADDVNGIYTVDLSWTANDPREGIAQYNVYRGLTPGFVPGTMLGANTDLSYQDVNPPEGVMLYYKITAVDTLGFESSTSVELEVPSPTGIGENIPLTTELFQNYPNPFNPDTTIKFSLASNSEVSLKIYNTAGALVRELASGRMERGFYNIRFDASDLVSGMYYYTLKAEGRTMSKKMILLK